MDSWGSPKRVAWGSGFILLDFAKDFLKLDAHCVSHVYWGFVAVDLAEPGTPLEAAGDSAQTVVAEVLEGECRRGKHAKAAGPMVELPLVVEFC